MSESSKEIRERYRTQLGTEFGDAFQGLWNQWAWSLLRRDEFRELFTRGEDVSLLNALASGGFTWDMQNILWEDLLLRVCRLTDPPKSAGKSNLSVTRLPEFCKQHGAALHGLVQQLVDAAVKKAAFARDWRNRRISHSDFATAVGRAEPLAAASLQKVTGALDAVHAVLDTISSKLLNAGIGDFITGPPRARAFLSHARQLVDSVKFIDAVVDPDGAAQVADTDVAAAFLTRLGIEPSARDVTRVVELRRAARRFA